MENQANSKSIILNYGLYLGLATVTISLVKYAMGELYTQEYYSGILGFFLMIAFIVLGLKNYKAVNGGFITFGQSVKVGIGIAMITSVINIVYILLLSNVLEPDFAINSIETQKVISEAEALQRHNDRLEQYRYNVKANIASFYASGRDVGSDRSVRAFLERQKEIATEDTRRSDLMGVFESMKLQQQATTTRIEGRARKQAAMIGAFTTMAQGYADYQDSLSKVIPTGS